MGTAIGAASQARLPAGTLEYDSYAAALGKTLVAYVRRWSGLNDCKTLICVTVYFARIDNVLTRGIQWMYDHPALTCYAQQQRAAEGLQALRAGFRLYYRALETGAEWRAKAARRKIRAAGRIDWQRPRSSEDSPRAGQSMGASRSAARAAAWRPSSAPCTSALRKWMPV